MRVKGIFVLLSLALMLVVPHLALAVPTHYFDCKECHKTGYVIDQIGSNICVRCHTAAGEPVPVSKRGPLLTPKGFITGDASDHYGNNPAPGNQTSHNWAATSTNPAAGAVEPNRTTYPGFYSRYGSTVGTVACSRCHEPHGDVTSNPKLLPMNATRTAPLAVNDMCTACHKTFADSMQTDHGLLSHPMVTDYATFQGLNSAKYKAIALDSSTAPDAYANGIQLVNGDVSCLSCHNLHFTDSDNSTADGPGMVGTGDGLMLRTDGTQFVNDPDPAKASGLCTTCHNVNPATSMHGSGGASDFGCGGCHDGHNVSVVAGVDPSYFMLAANYTELPTEFGGTANREDLWGGTQLGVVDGFCETCHGDIADPGFNAVRSHNQGEDCSVCHLSHGDGAFSDPIGCDGCHGSPPQLATAGNPLAANYVASDGYAWAPDGALMGTPYSYELSNGDAGPVNAFYKNETQTPHTSHAGASSNYSFQCQVCHNTHIDDFAGTHNQNNTSFQDVLESGYTFDSRAVAAGAGNPSYNDGAATGTCSTVYCHSNGGVNDGAGTRTFSFNNPDWTDGTGTGSKGSEIDGSGGECQFCHGNDAATMTTRSNSTTHQAHLGQGYNCNICHVDTAASGTALAAGAINNTHLSQAVDVVFDESSSLKAGGGAMANGASPWGGSGNVTCSAVYCHSSGQSTPADITYNAITWIDTLPDSGGTPAEKLAYCTSCHDVHNGNNETLSHKVHVGGSSSDVGRDLDCGTCHANTVSVGDNLAISGPARHVNGVVDTDVVMDIFGDNADCSNIYCHSTGQSTSVANDATPTYATPVWANAASGDCGTCHKVTEASGLNSGSHSKHLTAAGVNGCADCHSGAANDASTYSDVKHVNNKINVDNSYNSAVVGIGDPGDGYFTCSAASCHDNGTGTPGETPRWGTPGDCATCHLSDMVSGSHDTHLLSTINQAAFGCGNCHDSAVKDTTPPALHLNDKVDVYNSAVGDFAGDYTTGKDKGTAYGSCATTYCHGDTLSYSTIDGIDTSPLWDSTQGSNPNNCDVCHSYPPDGVAGAGSAHPTSTSCDSCHFHVNATNDGFDDVTKHIDGIVQIDGGSTCTDCHGSGKYKDPNTLHPDHADHTDVDAFLGTKTLATNDYGDPAKGWFDVTYDATGRLITGCGQCHPDDQATYHLSGAVDIQLDPTSASQVIPTPNAKLGNTGESYSSSTCSAVYCHSDGDGTYDATPPTWGGAAEDLTCGDCHGNSPTTAAHGLHEVGIHYEELYDDDGDGLMAKSTDDIGAADGAGGNYGAAAAHGNNTQSTTINCFTCHNGTVTDSANSDNTTCTTCHAGATGSAGTGDELARIAANSSVHLNGAKTVSFADMSAFMSKAQVRDNLADADDGSNILSDIWNRVTGYKNPAGTSYDQPKAAFSTPVFTQGPDTCSTVACHNGNAATWSDSAVDCMYCHTSLPK